MAAHLGPARAQAWLFAPHPGARDLEPAVLAWYSDRLLGLALVLLQEEPAADAGRRHLN